MLSRSILTTVLVCGATAFAAEPARDPPPLAESIDFNRDVRPILSEFCFKCHGFDEKAREGGRRIDTLEGATAEIDGVRAIVPGDPAASAVHRRIHTTVRDDAMPPAKTGKSLSAQQKSIIDRWIEQGARYARHWAFESVRRPAVPHSPALHPIDAFVRARLDATGLAPSPEADPYRLCRRLYFDLTGVPPTPDEADAFVRALAADPRAVERLVDRLLGSPRYGERWARRWLDLARYADTNGYEKDRPRSIWPWRDWVIDALNADLPFDQFTIQQLAGDMLPGATTAQRVATGFHRNTMLNEEGGIDPLEFRFHAMTDRVATTGTTWLGLTVGCAQCHSHKYDPIQHREYYQMMAFFDNADEPDLDLADAALAGSVRAHEAAIEQLITELPRHWPAGGADMEARFTEWLAAERQRSMVWSVARPVEAKSNLPHLEVQRDGSVIASGDTTKSDTYELRFAGLPPGTTAVRLEALPDEHLPAHGPGMAYYEGPKGDFFLGEFRLAADGQPVAFGPASESYAKNAMGEKNPVSAALATDGDPQTGWSTSGREGEAHEAVFPLAAPLPAVREVRLTMTFGRHYAASLGRFRISVTTERRPAMARRVSGEAAGLLAMPESALDVGKRDRLRREFLLSAPELAEARAAIDRLRRARPKPDTTLVMHERPSENARATFVHSRGEYLQPEERVEPGVFSFLPSLAPVSARNRLEFARWLVSPENPLTARVVVNRAWADFFGTGLVKTLEDFGIRGELPTHPELLDWLADEFVRQGWSMKRLHRLIATSATYRQSSRVTPDQLARDPANRMLSRGPRGRVEAEMVRDSALHAAGLLSTTLGGPSVRPPQPEGAVGVSYSKSGWEASQGEDRFRRGLYTFAKRTEPYAMATTFDAPTGESCAPRRDVSNTPLQALAILNDVVFVEAAQALGREFAARPESLDDRIRALFRRILTRPPADREVFELRRFFGTQSERLVAGSLNAGALAGTPDAEAAAWTTLSRALFNLDEAVTKD